MKNERAIQFLKGDRNKQKKSCMKISDFEQRFSQNFALHILKFFKKRINFRGISKVFERGPKK